MIPVNGSNNVNNNIKIDLNKITQPTVSSTNSTFGDGYADSKTTLAITRNIPGLENLIAKYDFDPPSYDKNIAQLTISDKDYIPDGKFRDIALQEA